MIVIYYLIWVAGAFALIGLFRLIIYISNRSYKHLLNCNYYKYYNSCRKCKYWQGKLLKHCNKI